MLPIVPGILKCSGLVLLRVSLTNWCQLASCVFLICDTSEMGGKHL